MAIVNVPERVKRPWDVTSWRTLAGSPPAVWFLIGLASILVVLIRTAWCSEDAYIGFRVADNFLQGQGLTWNVGERVQVYTDPLFQFLIIIGSWISGSDYWAAIVVSLLLSAGAVFFQLWGRSVRAILLGSLILLVSKGFMDFSVSGLENPATHLLVAAYVCVYWRDRDVFWLTLIASLAAVNRMDSALLFAPSLIWVYRCRGWQVWKSVIAASLPFLAWEAFSLFYYGFLFPNTAYAKLNTGIPLADSVHQGIRYLQNAVSWDLITMLVIVAGIAIGFATKEWPLALGAGLSVIYVVNIGGDYMAGRFLTPAFMLCFAIVIRNTPQNRTQLLSVGSAVLMLGLLMPNPAVLTTRNFGADPGGKEYLGVSDERAIWYQSTGLLRWSPDAPWPNHLWREEGLKLRNSGARFADLKPVGLIPYFAGPAVYVYDRGALADPLTARMKMVPGPWRTGHYWREPPPGYFETLQTGVNRIQDRKLAEYYDHLRNITRGDLWSISRFKDIVAMNCGLYDHLIAGSVVPKK